MGSWQLVARRGLYETGGRSTETEGDKDGGGQEESVRFPGGGLEVESGNDKLQSAKTVTLGVQCTHKHLVQVSTQADDPNRGSHFQWSNQKSVRAKCLLSHIAAPSGARTSV